MTHAAIIKVWEFHHLPRDLEPHEQTLASAVDRIGWDKVRAYQNAQFIWGDLPRMYRACLIVADKRYSDALECVLEDYELSLEDQDEVLEIELAVAEAMAE